MRTIAGEKLESRKGSGGEGGGDFLKALTNWVVKCRVVVDVFVKCVKDNWDENESVAGQNREAVE
jgi:hypothetical protein